MSLARQRISDPRARFETGDATHLPWNSAVRDVTAAGLVLNFVRDHDGMVREMARVTRPGGTVAAYVWDYAGGMQSDAALLGRGDRREPRMTRSSTRPRQFPLSARAAQALFEKSGLKAVETRAIEIPTVFQTFDDYWKPFLGRTGAAPTYLASVDGEDARTESRRHLESRLAPTAGQADRADRSSVGGSGSCLMLTISATEEWRAAHPGATIGLLELSGLESTGSSSQIDRAQTRRRSWLARALQRIYPSGLPGASGDGRVRAVLQALQQDLSRAAAARVDRPESASLFPTYRPPSTPTSWRKSRRLILTAGHDVEKLRAPIVIDASREGEQMTQMNGTPRAIRSGDMIMRDADGISCSVIYGQDARSPVSPQTSRVLYVAYAPAGVAAEVVERQLRGIEEHIRLVSPGVAVEQRRLLTA